VLVAGILTGQFRLMAEIEGTVIFWMAPKNKRLRRWMLFRQRDLLVL
jgi:hypothetical protein